MMRKFKESRFKTFYTVFVGTKTFFGGFFGGVYSSLFAWQLERLASFLLMHSEEESGIKAQISGVCQSTHIC